MTALELKRIFQKGECLSLETMRLYQSGKLSSTSVHEVEKHLLECGLCAAALEGLSPQRRASVDKISSHVHRRLAVYMNTPPRLSFFQRYGVAIATVALLFVGAGSWLIYKANQPDPHAVDTAQVSPPTVIPPPASTTSISEDRPANPVDFASGPAETQPDPILKTTDKESSTQGQTVAALVSNPLPTAAQAQPVSEKKTTTSTETASTEAKFSEGPTTRTAAPVAMRVKSVSVLNKMEHVERSGRSGKTSDGQLGRSSKSNGGFQLDEMPQYPGGDQALRDYVISNFKMPQIDRSKLTRFATGITFLVNAKTGEVSQVELTYSISPEVDAELLRVIKAMPRWNPGTRRGTIDVILGFTLE